MKTWFRRPLAMMCAILILMSCCVVPVSAATYRNGAQSGPSTSYANGRYYKNYLRVPITGDNRTDLIAMALSQLGYQEGAANGAFSGEVSGRNNYVEFSYNMGNLGLGYGGSDYPWCASFVSWCLYQSHCTNHATYRELGRNHVGDYTYIWKEISCSQWVRQLKGAGYYKYSAYEGGTYTPKAGDLVFFQNSNGVAHIGICLYTKNGRIYTVEGNTSDSSGLEANGGGVYFKNYLLTTSYINGYGVLPYKSNNSVPDIDYSGANPTPGLYVANATKYIYGSETDTSYDYILDRFSMFEVTQVCSNGRLKGIFTERGGSTVTGYITNNSDRVIQLSSTETGAAEAARTDLEAAVKAADAIRHYSYPEATILQIRSAYDNARTVLANSSASASALTSAEETLSALMAQTGSNTIARNNEGIFINGRNGLIGAGDCFIFSPTWNDGLITVDNANIRYTINVVCKWDEAQKLNVVKSITYGTGNSTPAIQLEADEFLIACHDWETGISESDSPVAYSGTNYRILSNLSVGDAVKLSGCTALNANSDVAPAAFLKFMPANGVVINGRNEAIGSGDAHLFTTAFNGGLLTASGANIANTLNVLIKWDNDRSAWVVEEKFSGLSEDLQLAEGQALIAAHVWEGEGVTDPVYGSAANWNKLNAAEVGQKVIFSGVSPDAASTALSVAANISFADFETGDDPVDEDVTVELENLTQGKTYEVALPGTAAHTADLTDGEYVDELDFTGKWFGFLGVPEAANCNTTDGVGTVVIDLGAGYDLSSVRAHIYDGENEASIGGPDYVNVSVSFNGTDYACVGALALNENASASYWASLSEMDAAGRYVKLDFGPSDNASWVFVNEVEVYGSELSGDENIALAAPYTAADGGVYDADLTDGVYGTDLTAENWFDGEGTVILDLGGRYALTGVNAHVFAGANDIGAGAPGAVSVSLSSDGTNYIKMGELVMDDAASEPYWACLTEDAIVGQYVKLEISGDNALNLLNEVQVFGTPYVQSRDNNIALGKDCVVASYSESPYTADLTDGIASGTFQYNVNNDAWFGFKNTDTTDGNVGVDNDRGIVVIDLGGQAEITTVSAHLFAGANDAGAIQPGYINVYWSEDGSWYDYMGTMTQIADAEAPYWATLDVSESPVTGRYVKLACFVDSGALSLLNEIKVSGLMLSSDETSEPGSMSTVTLTGSFNSWNTTPNMQNVDVDNVSTTLTLDAGTHTLKILYGSDSYGSASIITDSTVTTYEDGLVLDPDADACTLSATRGGNYRFTFNKVTKALTVEYVPNTLYLRGSFNDWGTDLPMTDNGDGTYSATVTLDAGSYEFLVADEKYTSKWPANNYSLEVTQKANVTVTLDIYSNVLIVNQEAVAYTVTFVDYDGTVLSTQAVAAGGAATAPDAPEREGHVFTGWDKTFDCVNEDLTVTAQYMEVCSHASHNSGGECTICGEPVGHSYENGSCTGCGAVEPAAAALAGDMNGWQADSCNMTGEDGVNASVTMELAADTYEFKVVYDGVWYGNDGTIVNTTEATSDIGWEMGDAGNCKLVVTRPGRYTFTFNTETKFLFVTCEHDQLYLRGSFNEWGTDIAMTFDGSNYTATLTLDAGNYEYKVANADWSEGYPGDNVAFKLDAKSEVTFTLTDNGDGSFSVAQVVSVVEEPVPVVKAKNATLTLEDEVSINIYFTVENMTADTENMGLLAWDEKPATPAYDNAEYRFGGVSLEGERYKVTTDPIAAKNMGDSKYYMTYVKNEDGSYVYSQLFTYSPKMYAMSRLEESKDVELRKLCVALLNYGAEAQKYFASTNGYKYTTLMNADLTDEQKAYVEAYREDMVTPVVSADASKVGSFAATANSFTSKKATVTLGGALAVNFYLKPSVSTDGMTMYYWSVSDYAAASVLTAENATGTYEMELLSDGRYLASVENIAAKNMADTIYVCGVYEVDGVTHSTGVIAYSIGMYCTNMASAAGDVQALAQATAVYGYYAREYFARANQENG